MQTCRILDDQYGERIYNKMRDLFPEWNYPVKKNVKTPLEFWEKIKENDIVLLDNYFPWEWWEEPLGDLFLKEVLRIKKKVRIVCISDYWERLLEKYEYRKEAYDQGLIIGFITSKDGEDIAQVL